MLVTGVEYLDGSRCAGLDRSRSGKHGSFCRQRACAASGFNREQAGAMSLPTIDWGRIESLALKGREPD